MKSIGQFLMCSSVLSLVLLSLPSLAFPTPQPKEEKVASKIAFIQVKAEQGEVEAQYLYGLLLMSGRIIEKNTYLGMKWLVAAAEHNHKKAQRFIADLSFDGKLVARDLKLAEKWYLTQNTQWSHFRLGFIYAAGGDGVERHCGKAIKQFLMAADELSKSNAVWVMATCPDAKYRNGKRAIELGQQLYQSNPTSPTVIDNLAAAYAENGEFKTAIELQTKAIAFSASQRKDNLSSGLKQRLASYQKHQPVREVIALP
ncbi:MAG: sel1 repeat family protein [Shewanella sp.]|nr:sel1 repeat family protein [Shewanella sp.]